MELQILSEDDSHFLIESERDVEDFIKYCHYLYENYHDPVMKMPIAENRAAILDACWTIIVMLEGKKGDRNV